MTKRFLFSIFLLVLMIGCSGDAYVPVTKFDPARNPEKDLAAAVKEAQKTNKRILLDVGGEWCIWCHRIDAFIEENKDLKSYLNENFIVLKINFSEENKNEDFLSQFPEIPGFPHYFVLEKNGEFLFSQGTGDLESGKSYDKNKFMEFLKKWAPKA
jgi:thioredoxin-related protein